MSKPFGAHDTAAWPFGPTATRQRADSNRSVGIATMCARPSPLGSSRVASTRATGCFAGVARLGLASAQHPASAAASATVATCWIRTTPKCDECTPPPRLWGSSSSRLWMLPASTVPESTRAGSSIRAIPFGQKGPERCGNGRCFVWGARRPLKQRACGLSL